MDDGYDSGDVRDANGHLRNGVLRGFKGSLYEGGHRGPFLARWPGKIKPGSRSDELLCLVDMLATSAAITGQPLGAGAGPDSFNMLPALLGHSRNKPLRDHLVVQDVSGELAICKGPWKLIPVPVRGHGKSGGPRGAQLYNLAADLRETNNVATQDPDKVKELSDLLAQVRQRRDSRPLSGPA
jgi:arylsulfatase A-like enzyme